MLRAIVIEGLGIGVLAVLVGYPLLSSQQGHVSCLDAKPSCIDAGLQAVFTKIGLLPKGE